MATCRFPRLNPQGFSLHGSEGSHFSGAPSPGNSEKGGSEATPQGTILCPVETKSPLTALSHSQCREHAGSEASLSSHTGSTPGLEAQILGPKGVRVGKPSWLFCHGRWRWDLPPEMPARRKAADCPLQSSKRPQASLPLLCSCSTLPTTYVRCRANLPLFTSRSTYFLPKSQTPCLQESSLAFPLSTVLSKSAPPHPPNAHPSLLTYPLGQGFPKGLCACGTVLEPHRQTLEQDFLVVEVICEASGQGIQHPKFKRNHCSLLWIPAGQQIFVEGDTVSEILWNPVIIQQTGAFHVGHKAACRSQRGRGRARVSDTQRPDTRVPPWAASTDQAHELESPGAPIKGLDGSSRGVFRTCFLLM